MKIGEKIKRNRKALGLTQTELGAKLGVQKNAVSKWECGRVDDIPGSKIKAMAALFHVPASYLIDEDVEVSPFQIMKGAKMSFGQKITALREQRGCTRSQLAKKLGISPAILRNYELDIREPGHSFIIQIAKEFDVTTDFLLGVSDQIDKKTPTTPKDDELKVKEAELLNNFREAPIAIQNLVLQALKNEKNSDNSGQDR